MKSRLLTLLDIFNLKTDEENSLTIKEITTLLNAEGFTATKKTIVGDIETLKAHGADIICDHGKPNKYYIASREYELAELMLLVDAVQAAKFITVKKSQEIIKKLSTHTSVHQADKLNRRLYVDKQVKSVNERVLYTVDLLHSAINDKLKITFQYWEYTAAKRKVHRNNGQTYFFSPYALVWNNDNYYVVGYSDNRKEVVNFRVDRIDNAEVIEEKAVPKPKGLKIENYYQSVFQMFSGSQETVALCCANKHMKSVIDRFGEKVKTAIADDEHFTAEVAVAVSNTFFGWVVGFGGEVEIIAPEKVVKQYHATLRKIIKKTHK
jgi:predicted DNA-binding transcriptional regulator YafY